MFLPTETGYEVTRRQWLLILGELGSLAGFSGVMPELAAALSSVREGQASTLPPGLYYPSHGHLSHAMNDLGSIHNSPPSETEYVQSSTPFHPQFFSHAELQVVARVVEILLGRVPVGALSLTVQWFDLYLYSTAGVREAALQLDGLHRALAVAYYGESAVRELETANPQDLVRSGLRALHKHCTEQYGREFLALDGKEQATIVSTISTAGRNRPLREFLEVMRAEAVRGYYTTAEGLKELQYKGNWYYASCPGCKLKT